MRNPEKDAGYRKLYRTKYPDRVKESDARYRSKNKDKIAARSAINYEIRCGRLVKPSVCDVCVETTEVEAHHEDYLKKLDVIWLCKNCHEKEPS